MSDQQSHLLRERSYQYHRGSPSQSCRTNSAVKDRKQRSSYLLQKKYGFNDNEIYEAHIHKRLVKRGMEYIKVRIEHMEEDEQ